MIEDERRRLHRLRQRRDQGQLPWLYDDVEGQSGACEGPESSHDIGPAEPAFVCLRERHVPDPDEVLTARRCAQGVELSGHVRLEVDPANHTENRADRIGCREQVECLAEHIHALDDDASVDPRGVQFARGCVGRKVAVDRRHRRRVNPVLRVPRALPDVQVRIDQVPGHDRCHTSRSALQRSPSWASRPNAV